MSAPSEEEPFDPTATDFIENPYGQYHRLRSTRPISRSARWDCWFAASFDDCNRIVTDDECFDPIGHHQLRMMQVAITGGARSWRTSPGPAMPPDIARMRAEGRRTTGRALGVAADDAIFPEFERHCADRAAAAVERSDGASLEIMEEFAAPVTTCFLAALLDIRDDEMGLFESWCANTPESASDAAQRRLWSIFLRKVEQRRRSTRDDVIGTLLAGPGAHRTDVPPEVAHAEFVIGTCLMISRVTHEGIVRSFSTLLRALATHPEQYQKLRDDRDLLGGAVEEGLRFDTTTQALGRLTRRDVRIGGIVIPRASMVAALVGSAHRDPARWDRPDTFDITRAPRVSARHLAFGRGPASCLGSALSRRVLRTMLSAVVQVAREIRLDSGERWVPEFVSRGLSRLPLRVTAAG